MRNTLPALSLPAFWVWPCSGRWQQQQQQQKRANRTTTADSYSPLRDIAAAPLGLAALAAFARRRRRQLSFARSFVRSLAFPADCNSDLAAATGLDLPPAALPACGNLRLNQ